MKQIFFIISILISCHSYAQTTKQGEFILNGRIEGKDTGYLVLRYTNEEGKFIADTTQLQNGAFTFKGRMQNPPQRVALIGHEKIINFNNVAYCTLFLEDTVQTIVLPEDNFEMFSMTGSKTQKEYDVFRAMLHSIDLKYTSVLLALAVVKSDYLKTKDTAEQNRISNKEDSLLNLLEPRGDENIGVAISYVKQFPNSYTAPFAFFFPANALSADSASKIFSGFSEEVKNSIPGKYIADLLRKRKLNAIGVLANNFNATDFNGNKISLSDFRDKVVLIDFWASWCVPCRKEIPRLKKLYKLYHSKGLEIISISIDEDTLAWKKAVMNEKTKLPSP